MAFNKKEITEERELHMLVEDQESEKVRGRHRKQLQKT